VSSLIRRGKSWRLKLDLPRAGGKRRTQYITLGAVTRREAEAKAAKIIATMGSGEYVDASKETVEQFAARWLTDWAEQCQQQDRRAVFGTVAHCLPPHRQYSGPAALRRRLAAALRYYTIAAVALGSGLRRGELLALRWSNIDLDGASLRVEQALEWTQRGGLIFKAPKTKFGKRSVNLAAHTVTVLRDHRKQQLEQRMALGLGKPAADGLVFPNWKGEPRVPGSVSKEWTAAMKPLGVTATFHSLRHTHASMLIASGLDILSISRRLGHGTAAITLNVYAHLIKPDDRAAEIIEAALTER
jgi:integrase